MGGGIAAGIGGLMPGAGAFAVSVGLGTLLATAWLAAEPRDDMARADALFFEGKKLQAEGQVTEACDRFVESNRLAPHRGGTMLNLGLCDDQRGRLLAAYRELRVALEIARREGRADRVELATEHLVGLEGKLSWLRVVPPPNVPADQLDLRVDQARLEALDGSAVPLEAGEHQVSASAEGYRSRKQTILIAEGAPQQRSVIIDPLERVPTDGAPFPAAHRPSAATGGPTVLAPSPQNDRSTTLRTGALITGATGLFVALAAGAWALERKGVVHSHCDLNTKLCDTTGRDAASLGRTLIAVSTVAFAVGAVGIGGWLVIPNHASAVPQTAEAGLVIGGAF
jgi:hypothetical protein